MKVYVITKGDYSNYHICCVSLDRGKADALARCLSDKYDPAEVEEYDTDDTDAYIEGCKPYIVYFHRNGSFHFVSSTETISAVPKVDRMKYGEIRVLLMAKDKDHAVKIATDEKTKFIAMEKGI